MNIFKLAGGPLDGTKFEEGNGPYPQTFEYTVGEAYHTYTFDSKQENANDATLTYKHTKTTPIERSAPARQIRVPGDNDPDINNATTADPKYTKATCRSCGAPVIFGRTIHGKAMPIERDDERGNIILVDNTIHVLKKGDPDPGTAPLYISHYANCPHATKHRRKR